MFTLREGYRVFTGLMVRAEKTGGMVYDPVEDRIHTMNAATFFIIQLCDGRHTRKEIVRKFAERFGQVSSASPKNADSILQDLLARNLVVKVNCHS